MIDSYTFGRIVIDGTQYSNDLIVFLDKVVDNWWRKEGHQLYVEDLESVLKAKPEVLVVGTGYSGLMKIPPETKQYVESNGIKLIIQKTTEACKTFNRLIKFRKAVAILHLTC